MLVLESYPLPAVLWGVGWGGANNVHVRLRNTWHATLCYGHVHLRNPWHATQCHVVAKSGGYGPYVIEGLGWVVFVMW